MATLFPIFGIVQTVIKKGLEDFEDDHIEVGPHFEVLTYERFRLKTIIRQMFFNRNSQMFTFL